MVIWFTRIRYDRGRHFSGDSGAAVWVDEIRSVSVLSCHVSECASPHIFAVSSVICFGLLSRGHNLGKTVYKDSIVIRSSFDSVLSVFMFFSMQVCDDRSSSLYVLSVFKVFLKSLNCWFESSRSRSVLGRVMSSVSRTVSGQTPMRGMIEEQSVQSASVKGSVSSSESVIDASNMSNVSIVKEGSESSGMSELVDRMLK